MLVAVPQEQWCTACIYTHRYNVALGRPMKLSACIQQGEVPAIVPSPPGTAMPSVSKTELSFAVCDRKGQKGDGVTLELAPHLVFQHLHGADGSGLP